MLRLILRHAWLNLWDKHMTTGRINQVSTRWTRFADDNFRSASGFQSKCRKGRSLPQASTKTDPTPPSKAQIECTKDIHRFRILTQLLLAKLHSISSRNPQETHSQELPWFPERRQVETIPNICGSNHEKNSRSPCRYAGFGNKNLFAHWQRRTATDELDLWTFLWQKTSPKAVS